MARCVIFCAGDFDGLLDPVTARDYVIAADGGLLHTEKLGIHPDLILGDFDSLGYVPEGAEQHPVEKDDTDAMLAARRGLAQGCDRFLFYGALEGARLDHTIANLQTLQFLADRGTKGCLIGKRQIATVIRQGTLFFPAEAEGTISVFCMGAEAAGVTLSGLKYTMKQGILQPGLPLGVSNQFIGQKAAVCVENGSLLVIYDRKNGIVW